VPQLPHETGLVWVGAHTPVHTPPPGAGAATHVWFVQGAQVAPAVPHEVVDCDAYASHVPLGPPLQHPPGQVFPSQPQVPLVVSHRLLAHPAQAAPAVPHDAPDWDPHGTHVPVAPPLQQPFGHEVASQTHVPLLLLHSSPVPHAEQFAPPVPQEPLDSDAHASHVPVGPPLQHPLGHELASHTQLPVALHSWPAGHALHAAPPVPHEVLDSEA